jgi:hypothetical protein
VTTYNQDFTGSAGALGAGDSITQMHGTQTINRDGAGHGQLSAAPVDSLDVDVFIVGSYGADQTVMFDVSTWIPNGSVNLLSRINTPGVSNNAYKAYFDDSAFSGGGVAWGTLTIGKNVGGSFSQFGSAIDIRTNPITTGDAVWMKVTGASPATVEVYRRRAGVDVLLGTRTDSTYSSGNLGFGLWWDGITTRQQIDNVVATDAIIFLRTAKQTGTGAGNRTVTVPLNAGETAVCSYSQAWDTGTGNSQKTISSFSAGTWVKQGPTVGWDSGTAHWRTEKWVCLSAPVANAITLTLSGSPNADSAVIEVYRGVQGVGGNNSTTNTTANPFIDFTTTGPNDVVHGTFINWDVATLFTQRGTTNLRNTAVIGSGSDINAATTDNGAATASSVRNEVTMTATNWGALVVELIANVAPVLPSLQYNRTRPPLNQRAA